MIAIVGGGISGLSLAFELRNRGAPVALFEAVPRVGGTIQSTTNEGFITEAGPTDFSTESRQRAPWPPLSG